MNDLRYDNNHHDARLWLLGSLRLHLGSFELDLGPSSKGVCLSTIMNIMNEIRGYIILKWLSDSQGHTIYSKSRR